MKRIQKIWEQISSFNLNKEWGKENVVCLSVQEVIEEYWEAVLNILNEADDWHEITLYDPEENHYL